MRVYNLSKKDLHYRKVVLPANGGFKEFPELDSYIPDNDKILAEAKVISFRELPQWWISAQQQKVEEPAVEIKKASDTPPAPVDSVKVELKETPSKKYKGQYAQKE